jgi:hypothetical protein
VPNFYQLLSVEPDATTEDIKRAFRTEIARYHPDKVQHLGKEFQTMAATRAAQLTEAYRTLMNPELRAEYDRLYVTNTAAPASGAPTSAATPPAAPPPPAPSNSRTEVPSQAPPPHAAEWQPAAAAPSRFASEHRDRDDLVRKATLGRFRHALAAEFGTIEESKSRGFDLDCSTKSKGLFSRNGGCRFAVKLVSRVDKIAVEDAWSAAQKSAGPICVFLMGNGLAPAGELAGAIADLRKKARDTTRITIIPVDVRDWKAHMPVDAPAGCKAVLQRLRDSSN